MSNKKETKIVSLALAGGILIGVGGSQVAAIISKEDNIKIATSQITTSVFENALEFETYNLDQISDNIVKFHKKHPELTIDDIIYITYTSTKQDFPNKAQQYMNKIIDYLPEHYKLPNTFKKYIHSIGFNSEKEYISEMKKLADNNLLNFQTLNSNQTRSRNKARALTKNYKRITIK